MNLTLRNFDVLVMIEVLDSLKLTNTKSRMRTRFKKLLIKHNDEVINEEKRLIINEYAKFDDNNKWLTKDNGGLDVSEEDAKLINENIAELLCEEFLVECNESNKKMLLTVADIILNEEIEVSGDYADAYDEWCNEFEQVLEFYKVEDE